MDSVLIKTFLAITQSGSITRAADHLGVAQPSLSQQLLRLEDELGIKLFKRSARGVALTEGGRVFEEHAINILRDIERAKEDVRALNSDVSGKVSIGLPLSISQRFGIPLILAVKQELPHVALSLEEAMSGHIREWLERGLIDLAVLYNASKLRHFSVKRVATEALCIVAPAGRFGPPGVQGLPVGTATLESVEQLDLIMPTQRHGLRQFVQSSLRAAGIEIEVRTEVDSLLHIKSLVEAGHGYTILPHTAINRELLDGTLSAAILESPQLLRDVDLVRNPSHIVTRASVMIEDIMGKILRDAIASGEWAATPPLFDNAEDLGVP